MASKIGCQNPIASRGSIGAADIRHSTLYTSPTHAMHTATIRDLFRGPALWESDQEAGAGAQLIRSVADFAFSLSTTINKAASSLYTHELYQSSHSSYPRAVRCPASSRRQVRTRQRVGMPASHSNSSRRRRLCPLQRKKCMDTESRTGSCLSTISSGRSFEASAPVFGTS